MRMGTLGGRDEGCESLNAYKYPIIGSYTLPLKWQMTIINYNRYNNLKRNIHVSTTFELWYDKHNMYLH